MKKNILIIFIISFICIYTFIVNGAKVFDNLNHFFYNKKDIQPIASQEFRSNEEVIELFAESFLRSFMLLVNNPSGELTYLNSMLSDNIKTDISDKIIKLRKDGTKIDYDYLIVEGSNSGENYNLRIKVNGNLIYKDGKDKIINSTILVSIKRIKDNFKIIAIKEL